MKLQRILSAAMLMASLNHDVSAQTPATIQPIGYLNVQGVLHENGAPVNGFMWFCWDIYAAPTGGTPLAHDTNMNQVLVSNGVANITYRIGDLAALSLSPTQDLYLQIDVSPTGEPGSFTVLGPRQRIVPSLLATLAVRAEEARRLIEPLSVDLLPPLVPRLDRSPTFTGTVATAGDFVGSRLQVGQDHAMIGLGSSILGGTGNTNLASHAVIGGGGINAVQLGAAYSVIAGGSENLIGSAPTNGLLRAKGSIGTGSAYGFIGGGNKNSIGDYSDYCAVVGGYDNDIRDHADGSNVGGGVDNDIAELASNSVIGGGTGNDIGYGSFASTIGGGDGNEVFEGAPYSTIGGGTLNYVREDAYASAIGGGENNVIFPDATHATISGGWGNRVVTDLNTPSCGTIAGGKENQITAPYGTISGGVENDNYGLFATVGGGATNTLRESRSAVIGGGERNLIIDNSAYSMIAGGRENTVLRNASYASISGGRDNTATNYAFAAGHNAQAVHSGSWVWSDGGGTETASAADNSVTFRARGGYRMFSSGVSVGAELAAGSGSWTSISDRNAKENFHPVDARGILEKVTALPVSNWNYKTQDRSIRHIGPTAQDFRTAFEVGDSDTGITTVDADGIALAAIQGLNQKLERQIQARDAEIQDLKAALAELSAQVRSLRQPRRIGSQ